MFLIFFLLVSFIFAKVTVITFFDLHVFVTINFRIRLHEYTNYMIQKRYDSSNQKKRLNKLM